MNKILLIPAIIIAIIANGNTAEVQQQKKNISNTQVINNNGQQEVAQIIQNNQSNDQFSQNQKDKTFIQNTQTQLVQNNYMENNMIHSTQIQSHTNNSEAVLVMQSDDILKNLYPNKARRFFNWCRDCSKENENSLRVDFKLTKELCEAILESSGQKLKQYLLNYNVQKDFKSILEKCIDNMVEHFAQQEDLKCMLKYLEITKDAIYSPVATMKEWLQNMDQKIFDEIKDIAAEYLKDKYKGKVTQAYELRASFYFNTGKNSYIRVPKKEALSLSTNLKECENELIQTINKCQEGFKLYGDILNVNKKKHELNKLKENEDVTKLNGIENTIKGKELERDKIQKELDEKKNKLKGTNPTVQQKVSTPSGSKNGNNSSKKNKTKSNTTQTATKNVPNPVYQNLQKEIEKLEGEISKINGEIEALKKEKESLVQKCKEIISQIEQLDKDVNSVTENQLETARTWFENNYKQPILRILEQAKACFENNYPSNKKQ